MKKRRVAVDVLGSAAAAACGASTTPAQQWYSSYGVDNDHVHRHYSSSTASPIAANTIPMRLGMENDEVFNYGPRALNGSMDDVRIYDGILTDDAISDLAGMAP